MKYCLFDGGDVVGPFSAEQLLHRPGFGSHSLVCPEEYSEDETYWKEAYAYAEFGFDPAQSPRLDTAASSVTAAQSEQFLKEMDGALTELSALNVSAKEKPLVAPSENSPVVSSQNKQNDQLVSLSIQEPAVQQPSQPKPEQTQPKQIKPAASDTSVPAETVPPPSLTKKSDEKISSILMQASKDMRHQGSSSVQKEETKSTPSDVAAKSQEKEKQSSDKVTEQAHTTRAPKQTDDAQQPQKESASLPELPTDNESEIEAHTISQVSPIEEYFNTMKSGDLGNILGIPDPKANSDLNLARVLEKQFEKTEPGVTNVSDEEDPFDEFSAPHSQESLDESLFAVTPEEADKRTEERLKKSLPDLQEAASLRLKGEESLPDPETDPEKTDPSALQEMIVPEQDDDPDDKTVKTILEGKLKVDTLRQEVPEPIKEVPAADNAHQEEDSQDELLKQRVVKQQHTGKWKFIILLAGVFVLFVGFYLNWTDSEQDLPAKGEESSAQTLDNQSVAASATGAADVVISAREAVNASPAPQEQSTVSPAEKAKLIVQNYLLDKGRGTVENYLSSHYAKQLADGYAAMWSAEPLHRDVYVVKYRLAKTRKEPIVYIFQADTAKNQLTGALNNITLDLVGKIK